MRTSIAMPNTPNDTRRRSLGLASLLGLAAVAAALAAPAADARPATGGACPAWVAVSAPATSTAAKARSTSAARPAVVYEANGVAVGPTKASVAARVSPGAGTRVVVQYGRTSTYRVCGSVQRLGAPGAVDVLLAGLQPDTSYHYRLVAKTAGGRGPRRLPHVPDASRGACPPAGRRRVDSRSAASAAPRRAPCSPARSRPRCG